MFKIKSPLRAFLVDSAFPPITHCALLGFLINLLNVKCSSVTHSAAIFKLQAEGKISAPPGLRQRSRFVGLLISRSACEDKGGSAQSAQSVRDQNKAHGNWACLFPKGEISSGQVDKVLIYDSDDGERKIHRRVLWNQDGSWTVKTPVCYKISWYKVNKKINKVSKWHCDQWK